MRVLYPDSQTIVDIKRFFLKIVVFFPVAVIVVATNFFVDPAYLFRNEGYVDGIAQILLQGKNAANVSNYDIGLLQQYYIDGLTQSKAIVILGSSRSMQIRAELFNPQSFFNSSVDSATIHDLMAVYEMYYRKGLKPDVVILSLDYTMTSAKFPEKQGSLQKSYDLAVQRIGKESQGQLESGQLTLDKYAQLVSPSYFQEALKTGGGRAEQMYYATGETMTDGYTKLFDGSLVYPKDRRDKTVSEVRQLAMSQIDGDILIFAIDQGITEKLESFIDRLQKDGVRVIIFLPPYHPYNYTYWATSPKYNVIVQAQQYFESLAHRKQIELIGSYNPADCSCDETEFFDSVHPKESCVNKIFQKSSLVKR
jgi:hypothetical protein